MSALLQQHDGFCRCRQCKPPLRQVVEGERQPNRTALIGGGILMTVLGVIAGGALGVLGWR